MTSTAQIHANRANAQYSTGPKTEKGKASSSKNARSHGLTAREFVIAPAEQAVFADFEADHRNDLKPEGAIEETLVAQILHAAWNLRRVRLLEAELSNSLGFDPLTDDQNEAKLDRYARYAQRFERTLHRSIKELRAIQNARLVAESQLRVRRDQMPALIDTATYKTPKRSQMSYRDFEHIMNIVTTPLGVREGYGDPALEV